MPTRDNENWAEDTPIEIERRTAVTSVKINPANNDPRAVAVS
jgi:hypothetical protein